MRLAPERCIEHVRHPVPTLGEEEITYSSRCLLYLLVLWAVINERPEGTRSQIMKNTYTHKEKL
jgi:hypothetical protein